MTIETSAFTATVTTKKAKIDFVVSSIHPTNPTPSSALSGLPAKAQERSFDCVRFLEDSTARNGMWRKYVLYLSDPDL